VSAPISIRRARLSDAAAVAQVSAATFTETFGHLYPPEDLAEYLGRVCTTEAYSQVIAEPTSAIWIAAADNAAPVGFAFAATCKLPVENLEPTSGEIRQLYVLATHQSQRLGANLMDAALTWLAEQRRTPLYIGVWSENLGAQRFYERYGFRKVGEYGFPVGTTVDHEFILKR
jgi:ribosomal protein S18 acetylase RimI-like enzyme